VPCTPDARANLTRRRIDIETSLSNIATYLDLDGDWTPQRTRRVDQLLDEYGYVLALLADDANVGPTLTGRPA
jgi:hypothetical protein